MQPHGRWGTLGAHPFPAAIAQALPFLIPASPVAKKSACRLVDAVVVGVHAVVVGPAVIINNELIINLNQPDSSGVVNKTNNYINIINALK